MMVNAKKIDRRKKKKERVWCRGRAFAVLDWMTSKGLNKNGLLKKDLR